MTVLPAHLLITISTAQKVDLNLDVCLKPKFAFSMLGNSEIPIPCVQGPKEQHVRPKNN